jgi:hypothetical protein
MTGRIEHWRRAYRVRGTPAVADRLDRLAGPVLAAYEAALDRAHGDPAEVILVRAVAARVVVTAADEAELARRWGEGMAAAVLRAVAAGSDAVVRFPDRAAHAAAFVAAVAAGRPADDWFFARFAPLVRPTAAATARAALLADPAACGAVLRRLAESGNLPRVLRVIGPSAATEVWAAVAGELAAPDADRPLFAAALAVLARLGGEAVSAGRAATWFAEFAAGRGAADWRDPAALAGTVAEAARFVLARTRPHDPPAAAELDRVLAPLDWLDAARLRRELAEAFAAPTAASHPDWRRSAPPARRGPTPRQSGWLAAVGAALPRVRAHLDRADVRSPANAALLYAAVLADHPDWADDPALARFVGQLLAAAAGPAGDSFRAALGGAGESVIRELAGPVPRPPRGPEPAPAGIETASAGVFLLVRAIRDLRLTHLAGRVEFPAGGPAGGRYLLAALAAKWGGPGFDADAALALLAGPDATPAAFRAAWARAADESAARFQVGLARVLVGHRLLSADDPLRVGVVADRPAGPVAVAGNEAGTVWPFAAPLAPGEETERAERWRTDWETVTGRPGPVVGPGPAPPAAGAVADLFARPVVGGPLADLTLTAAAQATVRAWARWLGTFHDAGTGYLLSLFVRRPGRVFPDDGGLLVELEPRPADVILQAAGYLDPVEPFPGSGDPRVRFRLGRAD